MWNALLIGGLNLACSRIHRDGGEAGAWAWKSLDIQAADCDRANWLQIQCYDGVGDPIYYILRVNQVIINILLFLCIIIILWFFSFLCFICYFMNFMYFSSSYDYYFIIFIRL